MTLRSALYVGSVMHRRVRPRAHRFTYSAFWLLIDLDEIGEATRRCRLLSHNRANLFSLRDSDHGDGSPTPLRRQADDNLARANIDLAGGRILMLCMPRTLGYGFNPITVYFCHRQAGELAAIIYEVHNTFGERHSYVVPVSQPDSVLHQRCDKRLHVSPFMDMPLEYAFRLTPPADLVSVGIRVTSPEGLWLSAVLQGRRLPLNDRSLLRLALAIPAVTAKVMIAIHWQAVRLWLKGIRIRPKPSAPPHAVSIEPLTPKRTHPAS